MGVLRNSTPLRASVGTWVSPEGESFALLRQVAFNPDSPFFTRDAEEVLVPRYGNGAPPVGTTAFFYVDQDSDVLYFRAGVHPPRYVALNP